MNLQICFMNETVSDNESPSSDSETCPKLSKAKTNSRYTSSSAGAGANPYNSRPLSIKKSNGNYQSTNTVIKKSTATRPASLSLGPPISEDSDADFFTKQAKLQIEARMALAQAKDMAHMQMEVRN